jgi:hypothetical protein
MHELQDSSACGGLETPMLPITPNSFFVDETGFEPVQLRLQRNALPLELFIHLFATNID